MKHGFASGAACALLALTAFTAGAQQKDAAGSKDSPFLSRYPGSVLNDYTTRAYDEYFLPIGPVKDGQPKSQTIEGKLTLIGYKNPPGRSALEIDRNYETALKSAGFETVFACKGDACGYARAHLADGETFFWGGNGKYQFSAKLSRPSGVVYISIHVSADDTHVDVIETKAMDSGLVTAAALDTGLAKTGHVAVYGIHFDTGLALVKPDSAPALAEVARLLQQDPKLRLYVVGHTDTVGPASANIDLSKKRAQAVAQALTAQYSIAADRLSPIGIGPFAPVASNDAEEGRALNRRVELVKQ